MDEYDRKLTEDSTALVDQGAAGGQSRHLVSRTWQLSLDTLTEQGLPEATTLLRLMSFWAADPVPMSLFLSVARGDVDLGNLGLAADRVEPALRGLLDHSLVGTVEAEGRRCVSAHGVLLDSVAASVPERDRPALVEAALRLLRAALPQETVSLPEPRAQLRLLAPHSVSLFRRAQREETTELAVYVVQRVFDSGDFAVALAMSESVVPDVEHQLGAEHSLTLRARHVMGQALGRMGHFAESENMLRNVLESRERILGVDHVDTLRTCSELYLPLYLLGRYEDAVNILRRAIEGQRRVLGEDSDETLRSRMPLPTLLSRLGNEQEFREASRVIEDCERFLPADHVTTLTARLNHADGLRELERFAESAPLAQDVLADFVRVLGPDHPLALAALTLTARVAHALGQLAKATAALSQLIERRERVLGAEHPFVVENREWLAAWQAEARNRPAP